MRTFISASSAFLLSTALGGCTIMPVAETAALPCGDTKTVKYDIPTERGAYPVNVQFKMTCEPDKNGVEASIQNHPWDGVGKTFPRSVGGGAPNYEYIPCADNAVLKAKWADLNHIEHFSSIGRDIEDIRDVKIDMRFRQDYHLRYYMLNSAKNICSATPQ